MRLASWLRIIFPMTAIIAGFSIVLSAPVQAPSIPQGDPGRTYYAGFPVSINVDGKFSDWAGIPRVTVTTGPMPAQNPPLDGTMIFAAAADANNLYVWVDVAKSKIVSGLHGTDYANEDSVEIYLNGSGNLGLTGYTTPVVQLIYPALNIGKPVDQPLIGGKNYQGFRTRASVVKTATGYALEASIPLHMSRWNITPVSSGVMGFDIKVNGATQKDRNIRLSWSALDTQDRASQNPSVFGKLIFFNIGATPPPTVPPTAQKPTSTPKPTSTLPPTATPRPTATPQPTAGSVPSGGSFSVRGSTILAPNGSPFVAKGVNVNGLNWVWQRSTVSDAHLIADCWRFNLVRVNSFLFTGEQAWPQYANNNDLDSIVRTYTSRGVVVMFEAHDRIGRYYDGADLTKLVSWFTTLAQRYKGNPYVWFDIINEPGARNTIEAARWTGLHQQAIRAIRDSAGANNIIVVEGANGGQDAGASGSGMVADSDSAILRYGSDVINFGGKSYSNIVFSIHPYDEWNYSASKMGNFFDRVRAAGHAIIVGEYGVDTGINTTAATQAMFSSAVSRGIGRVAWHWDGHDYNDFTANAVWGGGWEINDCSHPTNLSWLGQQVWNDNHSG